MAGMMLPGKPNISPWSWTVWELEFGALALSGVGELTGVCAGKQAGQETEL